MTAPNGTTLEGSIRELGLHEVCQLLGATRKSGVLAIRAPLQGVAAEIVFHLGSVTDADTWPVHATTAPQARPDGVRGAPDRQCLETRVLELLTWSDGAFRFVAHEAAKVVVNGPRLSIEPLLVMAAERAEIWERLADRLEGAHAVPAFVEGDVDASRLPELRLAPREWEVLTRVDGVRDLAELASALGRELLEVAQLVHGLIGKGLLSIGRSGAALRRHATPPSNAAVNDAEDGDLWIPGDDQDAIFDPVCNRVVTPNGLPRLRTPSMSPASQDGGRGAVASPAHRPSSMREADATLLSSTDPAVLCREGDEAARRGDLTGAYSLWESALRLYALPGGGRSMGVNQQRVREAMALAARLQALLSHSPPVAPEN
ncbi:MAG: DUF4388 domain-containing protein [Gemmatimonas sp.]